MLATACLNGRMQNLRSHVRILIYWTWAIHVDDEASENLLKGCQALESPYNYNGSWKLLLLVYIQGRAFDILQMIW